MPRRQYLTCALTVVLLPALLGPAGRPAATQTPVLGEIIDIATGSYDHYRPAVAYNSLHREWLVVWHHPSGIGGLEVCAQRIGIGGELRGVLYLVAGSPTTQSWQADVAYSPAQDEYLIVYTHNASNGVEVWGRRYSWDLSSWQGAAFAVCPLTAPVPPATPDAQRNPAVAYNSQDDEFIIAWDWEHTTGGLRDVWARRMRADDGFLYPYICVASGGAPGANGKDRTDPDVAHNPARNQYLIAYTHQFGPTDGDILAKVVAADLAGSSTASELGLVENAYDQHRPAVAAGPDEFLAVWSDGPDTGHRTIYGRRVNGDGSLGSTYVPIMNLTNQVHTAPAVAFGWAGRYLVTWHHVFKIGGVEDDADVYGRYVRAGQNVAAGDVFPIDWRLKEQRNPAVACDPGGDCLVVEEDFSSGSLYEIRGRFVGPQRVYLPLALRGG